MRARCDCDLGWARAGPRLGSTVRRPGGQVPEGSGNHTPARSGVDRGRDPGQGRVRGTERGRPKFWSGEV